MTSCLSLSTSSSERREQTRWNTPWDTFHFPNWLHLAKPTCHFLCKQEVHRCLPKREKMLSNFNVKRKLKIKNSNYLEKKETKTRIFLTSIHVAVTEGDYKRFWACMLLLGKELISEPTNKRTSERVNDLKPAGRLTFKSCARSTGSKRFCGKESGREALRKWTFLCSVITLFCFACSKTGKKRENMYS